MFQLQPKEECRQEIDEAERKRLLKIKENLSGKEIDKIVEETKQLLAFQSAMRIYPSCRLLN